MAIVSRRKLEKFSKVLESEARSFCVLPAGRARPDRFLGGPDVLLQGQPFLGQALQFSIERRFGDEASAETLENHLFRSNRLLELGLKAGDFGPGFRRMHGLGIAGGLGALEVIIPNYLFDDSRPKAGFDNVDSQHGKRACIRGAPGPAPTRADVVKDAP